MNLRPRDYGLKNTLNTEGTERSRSRRNLLKTSRREKRGKKTQEASTVNFRCKESNGASSPFIGRVCNKKRVTWGLSLLNP